MIARPALASEGPEAGLFGGQVARRGRARVEIDLVVAAAEKGCAGRRHEPFDIAIVAGVLHHMDDDEARNLMALLRRAVPRGRVITGDIVVLPQQDFIIRQVIAWDRGRNARTPQGYEALARPFFQDVAGRVIRRSVIDGWMMECS